MMTPGVLFSHRRTGLHASACALLVVTVLVVMFAPSHPGRGNLPEFPQSDIDARKQAFFAYLRPIAEHFNERILDERADVLRIAAKGAVAWTDSRRLHYLARKYRIDDQSLDAEELLALLQRRVDIVPVSLVLVQAAKESAWGRSRFARKGNALFGEWCFAKGCGIVPNARADNRSHEVQSFANVHDATGSYMLNLNTHQGYYDLRIARQRLREVGSEPTGLALASYLSMYSERRDAYVREIRNMIVQNGLESP